MSISDPIPSQTIIDTLFVIAPQFYTTDPAKLANYNTMIGLLRCQDKDLGFEEIQRQIALLDGSYVKVGFQEGTVTKAQVKGQWKQTAGLSIPQIAAENEFGTKTIPARPFMSTSFDENKALINKAIQGEYNMIIRRSILYKSLTKF